MRLLLVDYRFELSNLDFDDILPIMEFYDYKKSLEKWGSAHPD